MLSLTVDEAYVHCADRTRKRGAEIPFGIRLRPEVRRAAHALHAFAASAYDFSRLPAYEGMREEKLAQWAARLDAAFAGQAQDPIFLALQDTVRRFDLPKEWLVDWLSAYRQDATRSRYETWPELADYAKRRGGSLGRIGLRVLGARDERLWPLVDDYASAVFLTRRWRDLAQDLRRDRIYAPRALCLQHGVEEWDLNAGVVDAAFRSLMCDLLARTRELLERGRPLCEAVPAELRLKVRFGWLETRSLQDAIAAADHDVFRRRLAGGVLHTARLVWRAWRWPGVAA